MDQDERRALARAAGRARPIGAYAARALDPSARARGFATTALLSEWPAIVGAELAQFTMPDRVAWPRRREDGEEGSWTRAPNGHQGSEGGVSQRLRMERAWFPFRATVNRKPARR